MEETELDNDELRRTVFNLDGNPKVDYFYNKDGLLLKTYGWLVKKAAVGIVLLIHGLKGHARFTYLKANAEVIDNNEVLVVDNNNYYVYSGSWIEKLNQNGYSVYAMDLQGHGESEGRKNLRGPFKRFNDLVDDVLQYMNKIQEEVSNDNKTDDGSCSIVTTKKKKLPMYIIGYSMGGNIALRVLQILNKAKEKSTCKLGSMATYKNGDTLIGDFTNIYDSDNDNDDDDDDDIYYDDDDDDDDIYYDAYDGDNVDDDNPINKATNVSEVVGINSVSNDNTTEHDACTYCIANDSKCDNVSTTTGGSDIDNTIVSVEDNVVDSTSVEDNVVDSTSTDDNAVASTSTDDNAIAGTTTKGNIVASTTTKDNIVASTTTKDNIVASTTTKDNIVASTTTKDNIVASTTTKDNIAASTTTKDNIAASTTTKDNIVASTTTKDNIVASTTTKDNIVASTTTKDNIAASTTTKDNIAASTTTKDNIVASTTTKDNIVASTTTKDNIVASTTTKDNIVASTTTKDNAIASTSADVNADADIIVRGDTIVRGDNKNGDKYNCLDKLNIKGCVALSGMVSFERIAQPGTYLFNYLYLPLTHLLSYIAPNVETRSELPYKGFAYVDHLCKLDKYRGNRAITVKCIYELIKAMGTLNDDINYIPNDIPLLFVHSRGDSICYYKGVKLFYDRLNSDNKELYTVDNMDHSITIEPGNEKILEKVIDWLNNLEKENKNAIEDQE
ncbi:lysophospholipase, putative [Plasmodium vinckei lentum]|uniref:Lysophospholipase, putative n=1 Tax=Plasmodium vinckei lentum TaxID=138297 RepID=A0A6V7S0H1_PLAVN|nr:lysophospholipase, putative [Plasmodium vinckei lentum]